MRILDVALSLVLTAAGVAILVFSAVSVRAAVLQGLSAIPGILVVVPMTAAGALLVKGGFEVALRITVEGWRVPTFAPAVKLAGPSLCILVAYASAISGAILHLGHGGPLVAVTAPINFLALFGMPVLAYHLYPARFASLLHSLAFVLSLAFMPSYCAMLFYVV